jgi:predicted ATPase
VVGRSKQLLSSGSKVNLGRSDALDVLSSLVEKSLVTVDPLSDGTLRYRLLEPIRQYAQELLDAADPAERVRDS